MVGLRLPQQDPLDGHHKYVKMKNISSGSYGFVVLAREWRTNELVRNCHRTAWRLVNDPFHTVLCRNST